MVAPELMGAAKLSRCGLQHSPRERAAIQVFPQAFAWKLFSDNASGAGSVDAKAVAIEHFEGVDFPPLPIFHFAPEPNRNIGHPKIEIRQIR